MLHLDPHSKPNQAASTGMCHGDGSGSGSGSGSGGGRERLKKLRLEAAGRVRIPDAWGEEGRLKDWADCSAFSRSFGPVGVVSAREALVEEFLQRAKPGRIELENKRCRLEECNREVIDDAFIMEEGKLQAQIS